MNVVSRCCRSGIEQGSRMEFPLGDQYGMSYKVDVCGECGQVEESPVEQCEVCGEIECQGDCE